MKRLASAALLFLLVAFPVIAEAQAVRYYISQIVAPDYDPQTDTGKDYYRVAIDDVDPRPAVLDFQAGFPVNPTTGIPIGSWGIVAVRASDYAAIDADPRNIALFTAATGERQSWGDLLSSLDSLRWSELPRRRAFMDRLRELGVPTGDITSNTSLRAILQKIGRHLFPDGFNETRFTTPGS